MRALEGALLATVLWEPVLLSPRRLMHEHLTTERVGSRARRASARRLGASITRVP